VKSKSIKDIEAKISKIPRVKLESFPTPLEKMKNLGLYVRGHRLFLKRDDIVG